MASVLQKDPTVSLKSEKVHMIIIKYTVALKFFSGGGGDWGQVPSIKNDNTLLGGPGVCPPPPQFWGHFWAKEEFIVNQTI